MRAVRTCSACAKFGRVGERAWTGRQPAWYRLAARMPTPRWKRYASSGSPSRSGDSSFLQPTATENRG